jgi:hypothetical protein
MPFLHPALADSDHGRHTIGKSIVQSRESTKIIANQHQPSLDASSNIAGAVLMRGRPKQ